MDVNPRDQCWAVSVGPGTLREAGLVTQMGEKWLGAFFYYFFLYSIFFLHSLSSSDPTVKILNIRTPKTFAVIILKFEQDDFIE